MQKLDHAGLSRTYSVDYQTTDSAASASAMFSGVKARSYTLGYDCGVSYYSVDSMADE